MDADMVFDLRDFEETGTKQGATWAEADLMKRLEYSDKGSFRRVLFKAMKACLSLNKNPATDFIQSGSQYKLTRFACYLVCMNADPRKVPVAVAQGYFASLANWLDDHAVHADRVDRIVIRDEVRDGLKSLAFTAQSHGVKSFALFLDAGYHGMYNMSLRDLEAHKGLKVKGTLLDHMGRMELAANLLRVTMTEARVKEGNIHGQGPLENASYSVGQVVRQALIEGTGAAPESLALAEPIGVAKKMLQETDKRMTELSTPAGSDEVRFYYAEVDDDEFTPDPDDAEPMDPEPPEELSPLRHVLQVERHPRLRQVPAHVARPHAEAPGRSSAKKTPRGQRGPSSPMDSQVNTPASTNKPPSPSTPRPKPSLALIALLCELARHAAPAPVPWPALLFAGAGLALVALALAYLPPE